MTDIRKEGAQHPKKGVVISTISSHKLAQAKWTIVVAILRTKDRAHYSTVFLFCDTHESNIRCTIKKIMIK